MKKLIVIGGPTASGKTSLAIEIAGHLRAEIISADSRQCYRELNIGVAKPDISQRTLIRHHFIDTHSVIEDVNAGIFERYALDILDEKFRQSEIMVCAGGTGMYIKALCEGIDEMPSMNSEITFQVNSNFKQLGLGWLQSTLKEIDPLFKDYPEMNNPARLMRALSFKLSTGESIMNYRKGMAKPRSFSVQYYAIDIDRDSLYQHINHRVEKMITDGLVDEAEQLLGLKSFKALQTVGYRELWPYFEGDQSLDLCIEKIKQHSRNYAKRQITWFKNQGGFKHMTPEKILAQVIKENI